MPDAVVIGAGAAGLAAARVLSRAARTVTVLEARDRVGGRMRTLNPPGLAAPVELGAEFIHGEPQITYDLMRDAGTTRIEGFGTHWERRGDALIGGDDRFDVVQKLVARAGSIKADISVEDFLARIKGDAELEDAARWFRLLVEGYDAADPRRASLRAIVEEWSGPSFATGGTRPLGGYGPLAEALVRSLDPQNVSLRLQSVVEEIAWRPAAVTVSGRAHGEPFGVDARCAIVTVPVSLLPRLRFAPALDERKRKALAALAMGPVVKIVLRFRSCWWEKLGEPFRDGSFFTNFEADFPTFWTQLPLRAPVLTAWAGGPRAFRLSGQQPDALVQRALKSLASIFRPASDVSAELTDAFVHDWNDDPFACGAYSYVLVGGDGARAELFVPIESTLFIAGEATSEDEPGTVAGALSCGERAAQQALRAL
ncbi:MAG: FAD-dependent oxidoreductase [Candidatus Eremiobacteraeota bacterium]|nr:FAD-dependent oxidoreductase [Candidatus Eremiobacteraeota bacterium]